MSLSIPHDEKDRVHLFAFQESLRGRPFIILSKTNESSSASLLGEKHWVSCFDFKQAARRNLRPGEQHFDWTSLFQEKAYKFSIFYGQKNSSNISIYISDHKKHDKTGSIIESIFGINAPGSLGENQAEGIGLLAASIGAGFFGNTLTNEGRKKLQNLSPQDRAECLRHALVFACNKGQQKLVDELFKLGAHPNITSMDDESMPLEIAIYRRDVNLVEILLSHGADPNVELTSGLNCKELAKMIKSEEILMLLEKSL